MKRELDTNGKRLLDALYQVKGEIDTSPILTDPHKNKLQEAVKKEMQRFFPKLFDSPTHDAISSARRNTDNKPAAPIVGHSKMVKIKNTTKVDNQKVKEPEQIEMRTISNTTKSSYFPNIKRNETKRRNSVPFSLFFVRYFIYIMFFRLVLKGQIMKR